MYYYQIEPDIYAELGGVSESPKVPDPGSSRGQNIGFQAGRYIKAPVPNPLEFEVDCPGDVPHLTGAEIPVVSAMFADRLRKAGVDNFQLFPAILRNPETGKEWRDHFAFNVVGVVDPVDMTASKFKTIMDGDDDSVGALLAFDYLVFSRAKCHDLDLRMFRLHQSEMMMFVIDRVLEKLRAMKPAGGWGFTSTEIPVL